jgi:hypothetical protein
MQVVVVVAMYSAGFLRILAVQAVCFPSNAMSAASQTIAVAQPSKDIPEKQGCIDLL